MMPPQGEDPNQPYPGVGAALLLTIMAVFASVFTGIAFFGLGALTAYGVGRAVGGGRGRHHGCAKGRRAASGALGSSQTRDRCDPRDSLPCAGDAVDE